MSLNLEKGGRLDLTKGNPGLSKVTVGCGWDVRKTDGKDFDLDVMAFLVGADSKIIDPKGFVYFNNKDFTGVHHTGDNLTGEGDGDDEQIQFDLAAIPAECERIIIAINIFKGPEKGQTFGQVDNAFCRIFNTENDEELMKYDLSEDYSAYSALIAIEIYRHSGEWKVKGVGDGFADGLTALCGTYGAS